MLRKKIIYIFFLTMFSMTNLNAELNYKKIGQWDLKMGRNNFAMTSKTWHVDVMEGGTLTLGKDKGEIQVCIEDGHLYGEPNGLIWVELKCSITMSDESKIYLEYSAKLTPDENFLNNLANNKASSAPDNGLKYWFAEFKMKTTSEKYAWVNEHIFLGKSIELKGDTTGKGMGRAFYDLYIFEN